MAPMAEFTTSDTCARCGLRRLTLALEQRGIIIRLCDDCFWGNQPAKPAEKLPAAAQGKGDNGEGDCLSPVQWGPLDDLSTLRESIEELCETPFTYQWRGRALAAGQPPVDVFETEHDFIVRAELPGIGPQDVEITVTDNALTLKGHFYYRRELRYVSFLRSLALPYAVRAEHIKVSYRGAVLEIRVPKDKPSRSKVDSAVSS